MPEPEQRTRPTPSELIEELQRLPDLIYQRGAEVYGKRKEYDMLTLENDAIAAELMSLVEAEVNAVGKPLYSNLSKRQAEVDRRLKDDVVCNARRLSLETLRKEIDDMNLKIEFYNNRFKACRAIALLLGVN